MSQQKVTVRILDRDYHFACSDEERPSLIQAAEHLDNTMRECNAKIQTRSIPVRCPGRSMTCAKRWKRH